MSNLSVLIDLRPCQSKLVVLQSLSSFLSHAIDPQYVASSGSHGEIGQAIAPAPTWFLRPSFASTRLYEEYANVFRPSLHGANGKHLTWNPDPEFESFDEDFVYYPRLLCGEPETAWDLSNLSDLSSEMEEVSRSLGDIPLIMVGSQVFLWMIQWSNVNLAEIVSNAIPDFDRHVS